MQPRQTDFDGRGMDRTVDRIGVVGASSLAGKELAEELGESQLAAADLVLLDEEDAAGQMTAAADEVAFIQRLDASSFERLDLVFFTGTPAMTHKHWKEARRAGASIIDMTAVLEQEKEVLVRAPWVAEALGKSSESREPDLKTPAVVPAHPAALMIALAAARIQAKATVRSIVSMVMEPASEHGRAAMDELHQQTVNLLSFQSLPREQYDAQVSFNLLPALGEAAHVKLADAEQKIRRHFRIIAGGALPEPALQMVQVPVFHGYTVAVLIETEKDSVVEEIESALVSEYFDVLSEDSEPPSNISATGQEQMMTRVRADGPRRFWVWMSADNLKLAALNAIACAAELKRLRPQGKIQ